MRQYYVWSMEFGRGFSRTGAVKAMNRAGLSRYRVFKFFNLLELPPYTLFLPTTFHSTTLHTHHDGSGVRLNEGSTLQAASKPLGDGTCSLFIFPHAHPRRLTTLTA